MCILALICTLRLCLSVLWSLPVGAMGDLRLLHSLVTLTRFKVKVTVHHIRKFY